ncbi:MAG: hypothetical protein WBW88_08400, partial [Rhodothermales bacterium]
MKRNVTIAIFSLYLSASSYAQTYGDWQWPSATLSTDKETYELYEPVIVTFTVTNTDTLSHSYSEPTSIPRMWRWTLTAPDGEEVSRLRYDVGEVRLPPPTFARGKITYQPGMSRDVSFLLQASWPTWDQNGTYTLSVAISHPDDYYNQQELASAQFEVLDASIPEGVKDTLRLIDDNYAFRYGYSGDPSIFDAVAASEALRDRTDVPDYVEEWALIAAAFSEDLRCGDCAQTLYDAFQGEYSGSGYAIIAEVGAGEMMLSRGETHPPVEFDRYPEVRLKVYLEGAYVGPYDDTLTTWTTFVPAMTTTMLAGSGPGDNQTPYSDPPWNQRRQTGDGSGTDWVLVTLLDSTQNIVGQRVAALGPHGQVRAHVYNPTSKGPYRISVDHRNHVSVVSDTMVSFRGPLLLHDFTTGHALGTNAQKEVEPGIYAMWAGDANADSLVTAADSLIWATHLGETGYLSSDFNLDGQVSGEDLVLWLQNSFALAGPFDLGALIDRIAMYPGLA